MNTHADEHTCTYPCISVSSDGNKPITAYDDKMIV